MNTLALASLFALLFASAVASTEGNGVTYTAAVLQHWTVYADSPQQTVIANLDIYDNYLVNASKSGAQIAVFPETALGRDEIFRWENAKYGEQIPAVNSTSYINPCLESDAFKAKLPALTKASCMARKHGIVLVIGTIDVQPCSSESDPDCPWDGQYIYNTAIVLDEEGRLIAKYHKYHLFFTLTGVFDTPKHPELVYFDTSFGVRFGIFICFEILFEDPAMKLLDMGIRDIAFPTSWVNVPPIVTATQTQQAWTRRFGTNLLAANNGENHEQSGSGIYQAGQPLAFFFDPALSEAADEKLLVAKVTTAGSSMGTAAERTAEGKKPVAMARPLSPSLPPPPTAKSKWMWADRESLCGLVPGGCDFFYPKPGDKGTLKAWDGNLTCTATYSISPQSQSGDTFALFAAASWVWISQWIDIRACGIVRCIDQVLCVVTDPLLEDVYYSQTVFDSFSITGNFAVAGAENVAVYPLVATSGGAVVDKDAVSFTGDDALSSSAISAPLIDATLFGRVW